MDDLEEFLAATDGLQPATEEANRIPAGDDAEAARAFRELGVLERQAAANTALAEAQRRKITEWEAGVNEPLQKRQIYLRSLLEAYARAEREGSGGKRKSISTPFGTVKTTLAQNKWVIEDPAAFIAWAQESAPNLIETKTTALLGEIKKSLTVDGAQAVHPISGELAPGISISEPAEPYTYTTKTN